MSFMDSLMRSPPSVVAATTGRASSETRRVLMRQLRSAMREPADVDPAGVRGSVASAPPTAVVPDCCARSPPSPAAPAFWACWGEEPRSFPPRGS